MNRSRSLSSSTRLVDFPPENEIHRNCLQLLFSREFNTSSDVSSRVIDCLQAGNWDAIDFSQLNQKTNFARTTYPEPKSDGTKTAQLLARTIFQYLIYHKISLNDLYQFICKIIAHENSKPNDKAFRVANLATPLFSYALTHVQAHSSRIADSFAKHTFAYYFYLRGDKNFKYIYFLLTSNMGKNSPGRDFFSDEMKFFKQQAQELLQSRVLYNQNTFPTQMLTDELDLIAWAEFQADQAHQLTPYFPSLESPVISDEQKLDDLDLISKSLHDAWAELQNQKQRMLELLESKNTNLKSTRRRSSSSNRQVPYVKSLHALMNLFRESVDEHNDAYHLSALQILRQFKQEQPEQFEPLNSSSLLRELISLLHEQKRTPFLDKVSEREPQKTALKILFSTEYSLDSKPVFEHLKQGIFSEIDFKKLNDHQQYIDKQTRDLLISIIFQYLFHPPISLESFNDFIQTLIKYEAHRNRPFHQPSLTSQLIFTCLAYIHRAYSMDESTGFITHALANIFRASPHEIEIAYVESRTFHYMYKKLVSVASMLKTSENDAVLSSQDEDFFLKRVNALLSPTSESASADISISTLRWRDTQNDQAQKLPPLDFDLQTTLQLDSSTPPLEQKKERDVEVTISNSIQQAWNSLQKQKTDMLKKLESMIQKKLTELQHSNSPAAQIRRSFASSNSSQLINERTALSELQTLLTHSIDPSNENDHLTALEVLKKFEQEQPKYFSDIEPPTSDVIQKLIEAALGGKPKPRRTLSMPAAITGFFTRRRSSASKSAPTSPPLSPSSSSSSQGSTHLSPPPSPFSSLSSSRQPSQPPSPDDDSFTVFTPKTPTSSTNK